MTTGTILLANAGFAFRFRKKEALGMNEALWAARVASLIKSAVHLWRRLTKGFLAEIFVENPQNPLCLENPNLLKLRSPDSSCPICLSDNRFGENEPKCFNCYDRKAEKPSGPPNAVIAKGRKRGVTPNAIVAVKRPRLGFAKHTCDRYSGAL